MQSFKRVIENDFLLKLQPNKVVVLLGARRVGKTSFLKKISKSIKEPFLLLNGEDMDVAALFAQRSVSNYQRLLGDRKLLIIDEAQKIPDIGMALKFMVDSFPGLKIIATGSSVFDLSNKLGEPLTGRSITFYMYPFAQMEFSMEENSVQTRSRLEERLLFGSYPELLNYSGSEQKVAYLKEMTNAYLLRDILSYGGVRNAAKLIDLLKLVAFQIGKEVSVHELALQLGITRATVEHYLDLLSKVFVIYKLPAFSRNLRSEIVKTGKWYFYDNGVRNALISNFNPIALRNDIGELWENYLMSERIKYREYTGLYSNNYFWRTYQGQEIDLIEEHGGKLHAFEFKWGTAKKVAAPTAFVKTYPDSDFKLITPDNYLDWIVK